MAGGLIQIVTYGSQDLFLTGTPEITFFKVVYRRFTNFSIESIRVAFDDPVSFGNTSSLTVPKVGDLMYKTYIEVILPEINFKRFDANMNFLQQTQQAEQDFLIVTDFMSLNRRSYVSAFDIFEAENTEDSEKIIAAVNAIFNEPGNATKINNFRDLLTTNEEAPFTYDEVSMQSIVTGFTGSDSKEDIFKAMSVGLDKSIKTQNYYFIRLRESREALADGNNENIKFAWVDRVGHAIIDEIEVHIGGQKIDKHFGDWLNIWYELSANRNMEEIYNKMIGNVEILTSFNREIKPKYKLKIPLQFWFCRYSGLALPLVALEYHDVRFEIKFRKMEEVSYIESNKSIKFSETGEGLFLDEVVDELGINIEATLLIDYIYLDSPERRRFAQASHEYLIEQLQILELPSIVQQRIQCVLNNFVHPSKELIWVAQKVRYTENLDGSTRLRWDNYSLTDANEGNPIQFSAIDFNSYNRVPQLDGNYFNYVQPYQHHNTTPSDGINMYSFSIFPEEHQPSGSANLSRLSRVTLFIKLADILFEDIEEHMNIRIYTRNLNILRMAHGMGGLAYSYG